MLAATACQLNGVYLIRLMYTNESGPELVPLLVRRMRRTVCGRQVANEMLR